MVTQATLGPPPRASSARYSDARTQTRRLPLEFDASKAHIQDSDDGEDGQRIVKVNTDEVDAIAHKLEAILEFLSNHTELVIKPACLQDSPPRAESGTDLPTQSILTIQWNQKRARSEENRRSARKTRKTTHDKAGKEGTGNDAGMDEDDQSSDSDSTWDFPQVDMDKDDEQTHSPPESDVGYSSSQLEDQEEALRMRLLAQFDPAAVYVGSAGTPADNKGQIEVPGSSAEQAGPAHDRGFEDQAAVPPEGDTNFKYLSSS
ncbi:uncharacterized protein J7T54_002143 [Emericellopsis cladophorae]|uniref:Uncharacterized protein n=1 Tax=Emericellopsis cladophorae TaxID=2686198 RepID=A0A9P9Y3U1_9HYPO|nr:uncharacterized protein J7T54_002143 [Emericellopsis cladophorae]KAI6782982.1 hypothetical protein J7T54_002143 [Emericellopsis cladophorae]